MIQTELLLLRSCSDEFCRSIKETGPIQCPNDPLIPIVLSQPPKIRPGTGKVPLSQESARQIERMLSLSCIHDSDIVEAETVRHELSLLGIAFQLVKPTYSFLQLRMCLDGNGLTEIVNRPVSDLGRDLGAEPYLQYQQHNCLNQADVQRSLNFLPLLARAFQTGHGSWDHPFLPINRALVFFCQGYTITPRDPCQFFWAAGLDCLYASKLDKSKQGSREIGRRMQKFLGRELRLYEADTVSIPCHQQDRIHLELKSITADIFKLRNAFAHGLQIPDSGWFSEAGHPPESGYAYQVMEQTEISLRLTLLRILEDPSLFDTFSNPQRLDAYFQA